ncbi:hypothetical protein [Halarcobacter anaerophilus]|uniref:hypothetical protein n=1 Tax=Halarcobacter anaerophilus TaxID=877500 RepID=UPI0005C9C322|nr:hypothetical protein [Halarcobacter anaerophilus]
MGIFDVTTQVKSHNIEKKDEIITLLKETLSKQSIDTETQKNQLFFKKFKAPKNLLPYDLKVTTENAKESFSLNFEAELLNVWILVILIVLSIFFTYGIGVILVIIFAYLQKLTATKYIENSFEKIKKEVTQE